MGNAGPDVDGLIRRNGTTTLKFGIDLNLSPLRQNSIKVIDWTQWLLPEQGSDGTRLVVADHNRPLYGTESVEPRSNAQHLVLAVNNKSPVDSSKTPNCDESNLISKNVWRGFMPRDCMTSAISDDILVVVSTVST